MRHRGRARVVRPVAGAGGGGGGSGETFFAMDLRSAAGPLYGWTSIGTGHEAAFSHAFVAGGGAGGRDCVEIRMTPLAMGTQPAADCRCGWGGVSGWPTFSQGESVYYRAYLQHVVSGTVANSVDGGSWAGKEVIIGGSADSWRVIQQMQDPSQSPNHPFILSKNIDGPPGSTWDETSYAQKLILPSSSAFALQWEVRLGPTASGGGRLAVWVNSDTYASPTRTSGSDLALDAAEMLDGAQVWQSISPLLNNGASLTIRISALEFGTAFDSAWAANL